VQQNETHVFIYMNVYLAIYICFYLYLYLYVCVNIWMYTYIYTYICMYVQIYRMHSAYRMYSIYVYRTYSILESSPAEPNTSCVFARACVVCVCVCVSLNVAQGCRIHTIYSQSILHICWNRMECSLLIFRSTIRQLAFCVQNVFHICIQNIFYSWDNTSAWPHAGCRCILHIQSAFYIYRMYFTYM